MRLRAIVIIVALALVGWYFFHGTGDDKTHGAKGKNSGPIPVSVAPAKTGTINVNLIGLGNVTPMNTVTVHSRVDGQLMRLLFKEGQVVKKDDLLAELDARPFQAQLEQAEGQMTRDTALLKQARIDLERYKTLFAQDSIAKQQLDLQASLVKQYEGAVQNDKGQVDNAKVQIAYTRITAPFAGQVGLRQVDPGNIIHSSDTNGIVVITQLQPITAIFTLPEDNIPEVISRMHAGETINAEASDRAGKVKLATGSVYAIDNQVDPTTGTVKLRAEFPNNDYALFPSQFVNIKCHIDTKQGVVLIPASAVQRGSAGTFVYKTKPDNSVTVQPVKTGISEGDTVEITDGISEGDVVVIDGTDNLREGTKIEIPSATPASKPAAAPDEQRHHKHKKKTDSE